MRAAFLAVSLVVFTTVSAVAGAFECEIEGIPERWALAACFAEFETDDELHPGVIECYNSWSKQRIGDACAEKRTSKHRLCETTLRHSDHHESVDACIADEAYVPAVVKEGVGG